MLVLIILISHTHEYKIKMIYVFILSVKKKKKGPQWNLMRAKPSSSMFQFTPRWKSLNRDHLDPQHIGIPLSRGQLRSFAPLLSKMGCERWTKFRRQLKSLTGWSWNYTLVAHTCTPWRSLVQIPLGHGLSVLSLHVLPMLALVSSRYHVFLPKKTCLNPQLSVWEYNPVLCGANEPQASLSVPNFLVICPKLRQPGMAKD